MFFILFSELRKKSNNIVSIVNTFFAGQGLIITVFEGHTYLGLKIPG